MKPCIVLRASRLARAARRLADSCRLAVIPRAVSNPTLVHHGYIAKASHHVLEERGGASVPLPLADLYGLTDVQAKRVAGHLAMAVKKPVLLADNRGLESRLAEHPLSWVGARSRVNPRGRVRSHSPRRGQRRLQARARSRGPGANPRGRKGSALSAYNDGKRAGHADRLLGRRSDYSWAGINDPNDYARNYAKGYRAGWGSGRQLPNPKGRKRAAAKRPRSRPKRRNPIPRSIDRRSVRTVTRGGARILVGCPKGKYRPGSRSRRKCAGAMRAIAKRNPVSASRQLAFPRAGERWYEVQKPSHRGTIKMVSELKVMVVNEDGAREWIEREEFVRAWKPLARLNPRNHEIERAKSTVRMWQDRDMTPGLKQMRRPKALRRAAAQLGELVSVDYRSDKYSGKGTVYTHRFKRPRPLLVSDPDAKQLHIVGGRVKITADGLVH